MIYIALFLLLATGTFLTISGSYEDARAPCTIWGREGDERLLWQWLGLAGQNGVVGHKDNPGVTLLKT